MTAGSGLDASTLSVGSGSVCLWREAAGSFQHSAPALLLEAAGAGPGRRSGGLPGPGYFQRPPNQRLEPLDGQFPVAVLASGGRGDDAKPAVL